MTIKSSSTTVHRISVFTLRKAAGVSHEQPLALGPLDHLLAPWFPIAVVFAFTPRADGEVIPISKLQAAIEVLLDSYPLLAGRLHIDPTTGHREVSNLAAGAELTIAECEDTLDSFAASDGRLLITNLPDGGNALLPPFDMSMGAVGNSPVLTIQHTRFSCGSTALGIRMPHAVCDADGYFQVVRDLAEVYRTGSLEHPPHLEPFQVELLTAASEKQRAEDRALNSSLFYVDGTKEPLAAVQSSSTTATPPSVATTGHVVRYTAQQLDELKALTSHPGQWVSTFEALTAYLTRRITLARLRLGAVPPEMMSRGLLLPVNYRGPGHFNLPIRYLHNCVLPSVTKLPVAHETTLAETSEHIHNLLRRVSVDDARRSVRWIAAQPDMRAVRFKFDSRPGCFTVSAWNKFQVYSGMAFELDEEGKGVPPALVAPPFTQLCLKDGTLHYLPTETQATDPSSRDLDVYVALPEPVWTIIDKDHSLKRWIVD